MEFLDKMDVSVESKNAQLYISRYSEVMWPLFKLNVI